MKELADFRHLILYAKGHYERVDLMNDLDRIFSERCAINGMSRQDIWMLCGHALEMYAKKHDREEFLREMFKPMMGVEENALGQWFDESCPLERAIRLVLRVLQRLTVVEAGEVVLNLGDPDPTILPLSKGAVKFWEERARLRGGALA